MAIYINPTKDEQDALYSLKDDPSIIIKSAGKCFVVVVVWEKEDCLKEVHKQLHDREVYEVPHNPNVLINTTMKTLEKMPLRGDLSRDNLNYFLLKDPTFARFYLFKIHKRLHDVPDRPVPSNCGFYTENIS